MDTLSADWHVPIPSSFIDYNSLPVAVHNNEDDIYQTPFKGGIHREIHSALGLNMNSPPTDSCVGTLGLSPWDRFGKL